MSTEVDKSSQNFCGGELVKSTWISSSSITMYYILQQKTLKIPTMLGIALSSKNIEKNQNKKCILSLG